MDLDSIIKHLQTWTNSVPVIILGSGASIPYNLPSMWNLGEHLKHSIKLKDKEDQSQFKEFISYLDKFGDLETALGEIRLRQKVLDEIINKTWRLVNKYDLEAYDKVIEGLEFPLAELTNYLIYPTDRKLSIITTNYDRLAEYAASMAGAFICNGFSPNYLGHFTNQIHQNNFKNLKGFNGQVNIWKVHGSLDWFKSEDETNLQLPLRRVIPKNYKPCIVTPGLTKYFETHIEPFRTILTQADSEIENANGFLCIGYGFNDIHVHPKLITQIKNHKPIIVITKELTTKTKDAIIGSNSKAYILLEQANVHDTRIYSSFYSKPKIIPGVSYWSLSEYLKLIKS
jgi:hypothetical protein